MFCIRALIQRARRQERGQVFIMVVLLLAVLGGMTAVAVDLGSYSADRRDLQNAADAIALAASQELPDEGAAQDVAEGWATKNGIDTENMTLTFTQQSLPNEPNPKVKVDLEEEHDFVFARLVGVTSAEVGAKATAIRTSASGGSGMVPLSVPMETLNGAGLGDEVVLKYDANNITTGNTSPIRIDSGGTGNCTTSDAYCDGVRYGSDTVICAAGTEGTYCDGPTTVDTQTGNLVGGTRTALDDRLELTDSHCDEFTEVFEDDPNSDEEGYYRITNDCNPFIPGGYASYRVLIVPVIDELCNGSCEVTIVDFALFFLEGYGGTGNSQQGCIGNDCEIIGRFVRANQNIGLLAGTFDPESANSFVRLVE